MSDKPTVFNYMKYQAALDEIERLRKQVANLEIKCRILEEDKPKSDQYKKGFEDAKRAFLLEYARRESEDK